jgi:hypothetical protein
MEEVQSPDQGALGGKAKCGQVRVNGLLAGICGWYVKNFMVFVMSTPSMRGEETRA